MLDLLGVLQGLAPAAVEPVFKPLRPGELTRSAIDCEPAARRARMGAARGLGEGLGLTYAAYAAENSNGSESAISASRGA